MMCFWFVVMEKWLVENENVCSFAFLMLNGCMDFVMFITSIQI